MTLAIVSEDVLFGPPTSLQFNGVELGASEDPAKLNITGERFEMDFQGAGGPIAGLTRLRKINATLTAKLNELSIAKLAWALQNLTATVGTAAVTSPSGLATTIATADVAAGATSIELAAATNIADGVYLKVGDAGETEIVQVHASWTAGTTIPLVSPLIRAHDVGDAVVMVDDAGTTILRQRVGIVPAADHHDLVMQAVGPDGDPCVVTLFDAINSADVEMTFGDNESAGTPITWKAYYDKADPTLAPYSIERLT
jgi:hypothetical protein